MYKKSIKAIHTQPVHSTLRSYPPNKLLNSTPPEINLEEAQLSLKKRTGLARLRSGYSRILNNYMARIDPKVQDKCPLCSESQHDANHLFNCYLNPTQLCTRDLWRKPIQAAKFLKLDDPGENET